MRRTRQHGCLLAGTLALLVVSGAGGCGSEPRQQGDGSPSTVDAFGGARQSFDVVALLSGPASSGLPATNRFTLVLDADARLAIAGGDGYGAVVGVTSADGRTFRAASPFNAGGGGDGDGCGVTERVLYETFEVTIADDGSLTGSAGGIALIGCAGCLAAVDPTARLVGTADATPPRLRLPGPGLTSPFEAFSLRASEPLPATTTARLVADDGAVIDLIPELGDLAFPVVVGFRKPDIILRAGHAFVVELDGADFAGLVDPADASLRLASFVEAPAVIEDGFESVTGSVFGGAMVITAGPLRPITGTTSLYVGAKDAPGVDSPTGRSLMVRLSRQPGDTRLRFSYRVAGPRAETPFAGRLRVGSEGAWSGLALGASAEVAGTAEIIMLAGKEAYVSAVVTREVSLPADATDEVLVLIAPDIFPCSLPEGSPNGLLIDDLRLE